MLTRETILAKRPATIEPVEVQEWGGTVYVKAMTAAEFKAWQDRAKDLTGEHVAASLIIATVQDEAGKPLFDPADTDALLEQPHAVIQRVYYVAERLNIVSREDARKNSPTRSPASSTASR